MRLGSGVSISRHVMRKLLATAALLPALATASPPPDSISELFAGTCMQHFYSPDSLRAAELGPNDAHSRVISMSLVGKAD